MKADLHAHTNYSDGKLSVNELLDRAIKRNIDIIAITDHDCVDGSKEGFYTTKDIKVIYGVELSTELNGESVHILGYFRKPLEDDCAFVRTLKTQRDNRLIRAYKIFQSVKSNCSLEQVDLFP